MAEIADDGAGGADPAAGWGLSGLADRVEALDGPRAGGYQRQTGSEGTLRPKPQTFSFTT